MATARDDFRWLNGIPKTGTVVPNRIFVGGLERDTKEEDLTNLFSKFGNIKNTKILFDRLGVSKGFGFVTFETEEEANKVLNMKCFTLNGRNLNVNTAYKKQSYGRSTLESNSVQSTSLVWPTQHYMGTSANFSRDSIYYPQGTWPVVFPPQFYLQQQCHYPPTPQTGYPQYVYSIAPNEYPFQGIGAVSGSDYSETSADSSEVEKNRIKISAPHAADYDRGRSSQVKPNQVRTSSPQRLSSGSLESAASYVHSTPIHHMPHPVYAKTMNGVTVMAYPSSFVMGSPTLVHVKDGSSESDNVLTELGFLHSPLVSGALTPPSTPCEFNANTTIESFRKN